MSLRLNAQFLLAGAIGAILSQLLVFALPGPEGITGPGSIPANVVAVLSGLVLLVGLPALYRAQAKQIRRMGLVGMVLLSVGIALFLLALSFVQILDLAVPGSIPHPGGHPGPPLFALIPALLGGILMVVGGVIVGITTIRAQVFTAAIGWIIIISSVFLLLTGPVSGNLGIILKDSAVGLLFAGLAWAGETLGFPVKPTQTSKSSVQRSSQQ